MSSIIVIVLRETELRKTELPENQLRESGKRETELLKCWSLDYWNTESWKADWRQAANKRGGRWVLPNLHFIDVRTGGAPKGMGI